MMRRTMMRRTMMRGTCPLYFLKQLDMLLFCPSYFDFNFIKEILGRIFRDFSLSKGDFWCISMDFEEFIGILQDFQGLLWIFWWILMDFDGFWWIFDGFWWIFRDFTGFLGISNWFWWILKNFEEFCRTLRIIVDFWLILMNLWGF